MITDSLSMNIPSESVSQVSAQLEALYTGAARCAIPFREIPASFLWGAAGIGKSDAVRQLAVDLARSTKKTVHVTDVRLLLFSPVDLRGVPIADQSRRFADWLCPRIFDMDKSPDVINILFLDELSAAPQSVQAAAYQITLDRRIGEHELPDNCIVIAAGNRTTDQSVAYKMPKALANRLMHFNIVSDFESWKAWALKSGIDSRVIGFLSFDNSRLCVTPESSELAYPTPRSWAFVSTVLKALSTDNVPPNAAHQLLSACVGIDTAVSFETWCEIYQHLPRIEDILKGCCKIYPKTQDALYALVSSLTAAVFAKRDTILLDELNNICSYALHFPPDFALSLFKDLNSDAAVRLKLMKCPALQAWLSRNKRYL